MHSEDTTAVDEIEPDERLRAAERRADELAAVARRQGDLVAELHEENRRLRDGELREALAPLIRGLARILDDVDRIRQARPEDADLAHIDSRVREVLHDAGALTLRPRARHAVRPARCTRPPAASRRASRRATGPWPRSAARAWSTARSSCGRPK